LEKTSEVVSSRLSRYSCRRNRIEANHEQ
jgi:hypothetical protein